MRSTLQAVITSIWKKLLKPCLIPVIRLSVLIRGVLSKPWIGPVIGLVVLAVSATTFIRQGNRWAIEDARIGPQFFFLLEGFRPDGWSRGVLEVRNRLDVQVQILRLEVVEPSDPKNYTGKLAKVKNRSAPDDIGENPDQSGCLL